MKKQKNNKDAAPIASQVETDNKEAKSIKFVVVRDGYRVSEREYVTEEDPVAIAEKDFWTHIAKTHSYGEPVDIVQYDSKKHRVW